MNQMDIDYAKIDDRTLAPRQWGMHPIPGEEWLDASHYPEEFVEF